MNFKEQKNHGITLIALIITIIVMLILVAVTITMAVNGGLFAKAAHAGTKTNEAVALEQELGSGIIRVGNKTYTSIDAYFDNDPIDQGIAIDETATLEIEADYDAQTGTPVTKKLESTLVGIKGTVIWTSNNKSVADVDNTGLVTAIGAGTAEITASVTYRDVTFTDTCTVTVKEAAPAKQYLGMTNEEADSGIGCYVKIGNQYGVIYADLAFARPESENHHWEDDDGAYSWEAEDHDELKKYYLNGEYDPDEEDEGWDKRPLVVADDELNQTEGRTKDRFYVMALTDFEANGYTTFYWDVNYNIKTFVTSVDFGSGDDNTKLLMDYWDNIPDSDTEWADGDIWKNLSGGDWFVPSRAEWSAFAKELGVYENYSNYGLSEFHWSSSQYDSDGAWFIDMGERCMGINLVQADYEVRLSTTF